MEPKFRKSEEKLNEIPQIKPEAHFALNDISQKIISGEKLSQEDDDFLGTIWATMQDLDKEIIEHLDTKRSSQIISKDEASSCGVYFLMSKQIGPDSKKLRDAFYQNLLSEEAFEGLSKNISIPENTRSILNKTL